MVAVDATRRNLSQGGVCYMLIQILQSIGQLLTSGARPAPVGGAGGDSPPRYGTDRRRPRFPPIYKPLVSRRLG